MQDPSEGKGAPHDAAAAAAKQGAEDACNVKVAVRVRPLWAKEEMDQALPCTKVIDSQQLLLGKDRAFTFDTVFGAGAQQADVYEGVAAPLMEQFFHGINCTVLAYGQTGAGKTYTMGTGDLTGILPDDEGIVPRVVAHLFSTLEKKKKAAEAKGGTLTFKCKLSFIEIYNESLRDLLRPSTTAKNLQIREDTNGGIVVNGAHEELVERPEEAFNQLDNGIFSRTTGATMMNGCSSRSHSILTFVLEQHLFASLDANPDVTVAKLHLVDLAGSERNKKTQAVGQRFKEAVSINTGLLALGNVISILGEASKTEKKTHVPYRDSKLTRLLQDSLGGNASTLIIACVSPADTNFEETLNTLKYANRAKNIRNKPIVNKDPHAMQVRALRGELANCRRLLASNNIAYDGAGEGATHTLVTPTGDVITHVEYEDLRRDHALVERELAALREWRARHSCWDVLNAVAEDVFADLADVASQIQDDAVRGQLSTILTSVERRYAAQKGLQDTDTTPDGLLERLLEGLHACSEALSHVPDEHQAARLQLASSLATVEAALLRQRDSSESRPAPRPTPPPQGAHSTPTPITPRGLFKTPARADAPAERLCDRDILDAAVHESTEKRAGSAAPSRGPSAPPASRAPFVLPEIGPSLRHCIDLAGTLPDAPFRGPLLAAFARAEQSWHAYAARRAARPGRVMEKNVQSRGRGAHLKTPLGTQHHPNTPHLPRTKSAGQIGATPSPATGVTKKGSADAHSLRDMVPGSMLMTGRVPASVCGGDDGVDVVICENQKLLRNMKQLEEELFQSECQAVHETEERTKLQSAFQCAQQQNEQLKYQNESLMKQLRQKSSEEKHDSLERLKAEISRMTSERGSLYEAKRRTELEKKRLERSAKLVQQNFQKEHAHMQEQLRSLTSEIESKTSMVAELVEREKRMQKVQQQNQQTIQVMETEKDRLRLELQKALRRLEECDYSGEKLTRMKLGLKRQYEGRLREQEASIEDLKVKQREAEAKLRQHGSDSMVIQKLLQEVQHLKSAKGELKNSMKHKTDERETERDQRRRQLMELQRQIKQLESDNDKYSSSLRVKEEALGQLQQQLSVEKSKSAQLVEKQAVIERELEQKQIWLDKEIEVQKMKRDAQERLQRELRRRERILKEAEDNRFARDDMRRAKEQHDCKRVERGLQGWDSQILVIKSKLAKARKELDNIPPQCRNDDNKRHVELLHAIELLENQDKAAKAKYQELCDAQSEVTELDHQLRQLDDRIDVLQAALEYGEDIISQTENEIEALTVADNEIQTRKSEFDQMAASLSPPPRTREEVPRAGSATSASTTPPARSAASGMSVSVPPSAFAESTSREEYERTITEYQQKLVGVAELEHQKEAEIQSLRLQSEDQAQTIDKLRNALKLADMGFNRRLLKVQLEHERILSRLIVPNNPDAGSASPRGSTPAVDAEHPLVQASSP
eukprot:TRINITY_DN119_c0_g2_i1.p1 TRINITY_DN119_c0_g2~~TRINITY_DN119_c0_g2_i1.p1  ORF type:complete len:1452 (+),score=588.59 TRINITY_DN119_c0_g2_i1:77-4432(+)